MSLTTQYKLRVSCILAAEDGRENLKSRNEKELSSTKRRMSRLFRDSVINDNNLNVDYKTGGFRTTQSC